MLNSNLKENLAVALVQSIILLAIAIIAAYLVSTGGKSQSSAEATEPEAISSNCSGTKLNYPRVIKETIRGKTFSFRYNCIQKGFTATSYDGNCKGCSGRTHFTNETVTWGICAVDPTIIKPFSTFYVPGYGLCHAADTGGKIKDKRIDLGFKRLSNGWWSQRITDIYTFVK